MLARIEELDKWENAALNQFNALFWCRRPLPSDLQRPARSSPSPDGPDPVTGTN